LHKNLAIIILAVLIVAVSAYAEKTTVSVMDLKVTSGVAAAEAQQLTNKLMNELVICDAFAVVDRAKRDEILKEQGFQMTGACDQGSCLVQAGQLLGVQKMIGGCIGRLGRVYSVEIQLVDVRTGSINLAFSREYQGEVSQLLAAMRDAAQELSSWGVRPKVVVTPEQPEFGAIRVKSKPKGAVIALDGQYLGMTPAKLSKVEAGEHRLTLSKSGFNRYSKVITAETDKTVTIEAVLDPEQGTSAQIEQEPIRRIEPAASVASSAPTSNTDTLGISGLVAYYPFNGNAHDASGNGNEGKIYSAVSCPDRFNRSNMAYLFDQSSVDCFIDCGNDKTLCADRQLTVSAWVKPQAGYIAVCGKYNNDLIGGWRIYFKDGFFYFGVSDGKSDHDLRSTISCPLNAWHHVACVYNKDKGLLQIFVNGKPTTESGYFGGKLDYCIESISESNDLLLGAYWAYGKFHFSGGLDEVRIYNRALNITEIARLYAENR